jgi:hypothetical protein
MQTRLLIGFVGCLAGLSVALASWGCGRGQTKGPYQATTTSAQVAANEDAISRVTAARCDREVACNNIGSGKTFDTREACVNQIGHDARADLRAEECPGGISEPDLNDCLADVRSEKCDGAMGAISRLAACRKGKLCLGH